MDKERGVVEEQVFSNAALSLNCGEECPAEDRPAFYRFLQSRFL